MMCEILRGALKAGGGNSESVFSVNVPSAGIVRCATVIMAPLGSTPTKAMLVVAFSPLKTVTSPFPVDASTSPCAPST